MTRDPLYCCYNSRASLSKTLLIETTKDRIAFQCVPMAPEVEVSC